MRLTHLLGAVLALALGAFLAPSAAAYEAREYCPSVEDVQEGALNLDYRARFRYFEFNGDGAGISEQVVRFDGARVEFKGPIEADELPKSVEVTCVYRTKLKNLDTNKWIKVELSSGPITQTEFIAVSLGIVSYPLTSRYYERDCDCYRYMCSKRLYRCPF